MHSEILAKCDQTAAVLPFRLEPHQPSTDMLMRVGNWLCCVVNIIVYLLALENAINALLLCNELLQWSYLKPEVCVSAVSKTLLCSTSLKVVKTGSKVHSFGKREQAIRRNPNVPVIVRGWLHKQVSMWSSVSVHMQSSSRSQHLSDHWKSRSWSGGGGGGNTPGLLYWGACAQQVPELRFTCRFDSEEETRINGHSYPG